ncbi:MAG: GDSL-type esterase/lipase family protein [Fusobacterium sp.]|nr:GDSL-type esterase/lipase family protein [Fusobacterium sp.]
MKKILCFGDSNTYGFIPNSGKRYDKNTRWTGVLQSLCGAEYEIIEAGCNNRTAFCDNPAGIMQTGYKILPQFLSEDIDTVILFIGTNDLQFAYDPTEEEIYTGITDLVKLAKGKRVILAAPPVLTKDIFNGYFACLFDQTSIDKSLLLGKIYERIAREQGCEFIDLNEIVEVSPLDGLHLEPKGHALTAKGFKGVIDGRK